MGDQFSQPIELYIFYIRAMFIAARTVRTRESRGKVLSSDSRRVNYPFRLSAAKKKSLRRSGPDIAKGGDPRCTRRGIAREKYGTQGKKREKSRARSIVSHQELLTSAEARGPSLTHTLRPYIPEALSASALRPRC